MKKAAYIALALACVLPNVAAAEKVAASSNQAIDTFLQEAGDQT